MAQPYKFLDYYSFEEAVNFYGRTLETEVLLSDIVASRLVLIFARSGTGKTSLINAGVRPRLERELNYKTFYIRVEKDPIKSARNALRANKLLPTRLARKSLAFQLKDAARRLRRPIVIFFDQFEEFFLYIVNKAPAKTQQFIKNIGDLYREHESGVHIVFSFREEFFIDMDIFRDEIPTIFHNESNLRLLWLDKDQARNAVLHPAKLARFKLEAELVERLLDDLAENGRIEPARLQIVCDTLWRERTHGRAGLALYEALGGAENILGRRLGEDINENLTNAQLRLFEQLIPQLANADRKTKYVRGFNELVKDLATTKELLRETVEQLKRLHLLRESTQYGEIYIEWMSDYLAERTEYLRQRVQTIRFRRLLNTAFEAHQRRRKAQELKSRKKTSSRLASPLTEEALQELYLSPANFETISEGAPLLEDLTVAELEFLFVAALEHGVHMNTWYEKASRREARNMVWHILRESIVSKAARVEQAENAVRLLGTLDTSRATNLLRTALKQDALAPVVVTLCGQMRDRRAITLLLPALKNKDLLKPAVTALGQIKTLEAVKILASLLERAEVSLEAASALERLAKGRTSKASGAAQKALARWRARQQAERNRQDASGTAPSPLVSMVSARSYTKGLPESMWDLLLHRLRDGRLVPFLGAGASAHHADAIRRATTMLSKEFSVPAQATDLTKLAQFLSVRYDHTFAKEVLLKQLRATARYSSLYDTTYAALAALPVPIYITTTYLDHMERALAQQRKKFSSLISGFNPSSTRFETDASLYQVSPSHPLVFYLFGHYKRLPTVVMTEDDYLCYLVSLGDRDRQLIPSMILNWLTTGMNLFLGYNPEGWEFRILLQGILASMPMRASRMSIIQLQPDATHFSDVMSGLGHYDEYFGALGLKIYWGSAEEFSAELLARWKQFSK